MSSSSTRRALATVVTLVVAVVMATLSSVQPASAAPAAPSGLTPNSVSVSGLPVLQWNRVSGATAYEAQVATSDTFNTLIWSTSTYNRRVTPNLQMPGGTIHWRVRAVGPTGTSPWAEASYTRQALAGPAPQAPADGEVLDSPQEPALLSWSPLNGAVQYTLEVGTDPQFVDSSRYTAYATQASSYVVPDPVVATEYYWRVKASLGSGVVTQWSPVRSYTIGGLAKPVLESPADSSATNVVDVVLDWEPVMGAKTYNLQISTDQNFNTIEHQRFCDHEHALLPAGHPEQRPVLLAGLTRRQRRQHPRLGRRRRLGVPAPLAETSPSWSTPRTIRSSVTRSSTSGLRFAMRARTGSR